MAVPTDLTDLYDQLDRGIDAVIADLEHARGQVGTGLSDADVAAIKGRLSASIGKLTAVRLAAPADHAPPAPTAPAAFT